MNEPTSAEAWPNTDVTPEDVAVYADGPTNPHFPSVKDKVEVAMTVNDDIWKVVQETIKFMEEHPLVFAVSMTSSSEGDGGNGG